MQGACDIQSPTGKTDGKTGGLGANQLFVAGLGEHGCAINHEFDLAPRLGQQPRCTHKIELAFSGAIRPMIPTRAAPRRRGPAVNPRSGTPL